MDNIENLSGEQAYQKILEAYHFQINELALKNMKPSRVYIGFWLFRKFRSMQIDMFRCETKINASQDRQEILGLPVYEVSDDPNHIHFC